MRNKFFYIIISRRLLYLLLIIFCLGIFAVTSFAGSVVFKGDKKIVVIDAGHGHPDGGAVGGSGIEEQKINLLISKKLEEILTSKGYLVVMTRTDEDGLGGEESTIREKKVLDMKRRKEIIDSSGADIFLSIHINFFPKSTVRGINAFYTREFEEAKKMSSLILEKIEVVTNAKVGVEKTAEQSLFLMKSPKVPGVLIECGFLSNPTEEALLKTDEYQSKIAYAIAEGVEEYFAE